MHDAIPRDVYSRYACCRVLSLRSRMSLNYYKWFVLNVMVTYLINVYRFFRGKTRKREWVTDNDIARQAEYLCARYIERKVSQLRLSPRHKTLFKTKVDEETCSKTVVATLQRIGGFLEEGYPRLYTDVVSQLNLRITFDIVVCGVFTRVCDNILACGVTWARVVAMYAFAAALANDCCKNKDVKTATKISKWMGQYTHKNLCSWIRENGGWDGFAVHFDKCLLFSARSTGKWHMKMAITCTVLVATIVTTIIAFTSNGLW